MATCTNDGSSRATSTYDVENMTDCSTPATGAPDTPSSTCSPIDVAISYASSVDAMATPMPLMHTTGEAPTGS